MFHAFSEDDAATDEAAFFIQVFEVFIFKFEADNCHFPSFKENVHNINKSSYGTTKQAPFHKINKRVVGRVRDR